MNEEVGTSKDNRYKNLCCKQQRKKVITGGDETLKVNLFSRWIYSSLFVSCEAALIEGETDGGGYVWLLSNILRIGKRGWNPGPGEGSSLWEQCRQFIWSKKRKIVYLDTGESRQVDVVGGNVWS